MPKIAKWIFFSYAIEAGWLYLHTGMPYNEIVLENTQFEFL